MKNKRQRLELIVQLVKTQRVGSQKQLSDLLVQHGLDVTQATLSRDLKTLKITKIATDSGEYMYIIPDTSEVESRMFTQNPTGVRPRGKTGVLSVEFSGNLAIIKTRNGYAAGLAYDIDMSKTPEIIGTIAGADTVLVVFREEVIRNKAVDVITSLVALPKRKTLL